jgi:linoleate 9S-lipoxygenase
VTTQAHADAQKDGWFSLDSSANLVQALATIAWVASGHHAAVNFGQYDYSGWMPSNSSLCRKPAPAKGTEAWQVRGCCVYDVSDKPVWAPHPVFLKH